MGREWAQGSSSLHFPALASAFQVGFPSPFSGKKKKKKRKQRAAGPEWLPSPQAGTRCLPGEAPAGCGLLGGAGKGCLFLGS